MIEKLKLSEIFVGRAKELEQFQNYLSLEGPKTHQLLDLVLNDRGESGKAQINIYNRGGDGGIGKTQMVLKIQEQLSSQASLQNLERLEELSGGNPVLLDLFKDWYAFEYKKRLSDSDLLQFLPPETQSDKGLFQSHPLFVKEEGSTNKTKSVSEIISEAMENSAKEIDLSNRNLTMLPTTIGRLSDLVQLRLDRNSLRTLPSAIGSLVNLERLYLQHNQLMSLPQELAQLKNLVELDLRENPLPIPPEILAHVQEPSIIINYYLQLIQTEAKRPLREVKMLLVGQGGVGKTQIVNRLLYEQFHKNESKTDGIDIHQWKLKEKRKKIKVNIWDFGGQEIMHATHQFFLTKRSLYLLVWDARQEDRYGQVDYWLKLIQSFGKESPIIIVLNKIDVSNLDLDHRTLKNKYPTIKEFVKVSCKTGENIKQLKNIITREISQLSHIDDELPASWFGVKTQIEKITRTRDYIEYREYQKLCETREIDQLSQETLIGFLHDLGIVLNFKDDSRLRDIYILNPEWVTRGVYQILNYPQLAGNGILNSNLLDTIFNLKEYPRDKHHFILDMMQKFELCFEFEGKKGIFLIPDLLSEQSPEFDWKDQGNLRFQYHYNFFPLSIMSRFIVRMHPFIWGNIYWKTGVILSDNYNKALIKADRDEKRVYIWVVGQENTKRDFLAKTRAQFEYIHSTIPKVEVIEQVPLPDAPDVVVPYSHLLSLEDLGEETFIPEGLKIKKRVSVKELLAGIGYKKGSDYQQYPPIPIQSNFPLALHQKLIDFLLSLPNIYDKGTQQALINSACLDNQLKSQINFSGSPEQFFKLLLPTLHNYGRLEDGRYAFQALLEATKQYVGQDKRDYCDKLCQELKKFLTEIERSL